MLGPITGLVVLVFAVLYFVWKHDPKNIALSGAITMYIISLTVQTVGFVVRDGMPYYIQDAAFMASITLAVIGAFLYINAGLRRRRRAIKKPASVEEVKEPVPSHS